MTFLTLLEAALAGQGKYATCLRYLYDRCIDDPDLQLPYSTPIPERTPTDALLKELSNPIILRHAVMKGAPSKLIAALCQCSPKSVLFHTDEQQRVLLHHACRLIPTTNNEEAITMLIQTEPTILIQRDILGRTPLHYFFMFHAPQRTILEQFLIPLPANLFPKQEQQQQQTTQYLPEIPRPNETSIPNNAAIVPDAIFGTLPLHYAVMFQATLPQLELLLQKYSRSKTMTDSQGRTPLHWMLGAAWDERTNIAGEEPPQTAPPVPPSLEKLQLLISSRVARTTDVLGRHPLHWAVLVEEQPSLPTLKFLIDHYAGQLNGQDKDGKTPLLVYLDNFHESKKEISFEILQLLATHPDPTVEVVPVAIEDQNGRLPLHAAVELAAPAKMIDFLVQAYPPSLVHSSEQLHSPLHSAFLFNAEKQTPETIELLLKTYEADTSGTLIDGRLGIKLEDANGSYPIHYAAQNGASLAVLKLLVDEYPRTALAQRANGDLPAHCIVTSKTIQLLEELDKETFSSIRDRLRVLLEPVIGDGSKLMLAGQDHGMTPLHLGVLFQATDYSMLYQMLMIAPESASTFSNHPSISFSAIDLHEMTKKFWAGDMGMWHSVRELLFAFAPKLESHRHREELLQRSVLIIMNELNGKGSSHFKLNVGDVDTTSLKVSKTVSGLKVPTRHRRRNRQQVVKSRLKPKLKIETSKSRSIPTVSTDGSDALETKDSMQSMYDESDTRFDSRDWGEDQLSSADDDEYTNEFDEEESYFSESEYSDEGSYTSGDGTYSDGDGSSGSSGSDASYEESYEESFVSGTQTSASFFSSSFGMSRSFESTILSNRRSSFTGVASTHMSQNTLEKTFVDAQRKAFMEEKKENEAIDEPKTPRRGNRSNRPVSRPEFISEVGMRLWTFFVLYSDANNPGDNYSKQVSLLFDGIPHSMLERLVMAPLPHYAAEYLDGDDVSGKVFRDAANPKCREIIHKTEYFLAKYDFSVDGADPLVYRSTEGESVTIRAYEWLFTTEHSAEKSKPGLREAEIWSSGNIPAEISLTFDRKKRPVWITFMKNKQSYQAEIATRAGFGCDAADIGVLPVLDHYDATDKSRPENALYAHHIKDARFSSMSLFENASKDSGIIKLKSFPYAVVSPAVNGGPLSEHILSHGTTEQEATDLCLVVARALGELNGKGLIHGNLRAQNVIFSRGPGGHKGCFLSDFSCSNMKGEKFGRVDKQGKAHYNSGVCPPEAFAHLSESEMRIYNKYWSSAQNVFRFSIEQRLIDPFIHASSGESYVLRSHFEKSERQLPDLPYETIDVDVSFDLWAFGLMMYQLFAGHHLFNVHNHSGALVDISQVTDLNDEEIAYKIYTCVSNPLAQDLLIRLLSVDGRQSVSWADVVNHPVFKKEAEYDALATSMMQRCRKESELVQRRIQSQFKFQSEKKWLESRSVEVGCWDMELMKRVHFSPSELVHSQIGGDRIHMPLSFTLQPVGDSSMAAIEDLGVQLLGLMKACRFARELKAYLLASQKKHHLSEQMLRDLNLDENIFRPIFERFETLASKHVETFRSNPATIALLLVQDQIENVKGTLKGDNRFCWIDELSLSPLEENSLLIGDGTESKSFFVGEGLVLFYAVVLYSFSCRSLEGLQLVLGSDKVPETWKAAADGLMQHLDDMSLVEDAATILSTFGLENTSQVTLSSICDNLLEFQFKVDPKKKLGDLVRVVVHGGSAWTTKTEIEHLKESTASESFRDALRKGKLNLA